MDTTGLGARSTRSKGVGCPRLSLVADATDSLHIPTPLLCQSEIIFPTLSSWGEFFQPDSLWLTLLWIWSTDFIRRELPLVGVAVDRRGQR
jgi:hypothetical protein